MAKKKKERFELRAEREWLESVEREANRWGLSMASYVRLAVNEKMERERQRKESRPEGEG